MSHDYSQFDQPQFDPPWQPPRKSSRPATWLVLAGILALVVFGTCCGTGVWLVNFGMSVVSADLEQQLRDHPQVREHLGELQSMEVNWPHSMAEEDDETFVYDVRGSQGSGRMTVKSVTNDEGNEDIEWARLRLSSGETIELRPE